MDVLSNIGKSFTGKIEKARLTLYDYRFLDHSVKVEEYTPGRNRAYVQGLKPDGNSTSRFFDTGQYTSNADIQALMVDIQDRMMLEDALSPTRTFIVKFNPNSMYLQGFGGGKNFISNYDEPHDNRSGLSYGALNASIQFGAQLIFDTTRSYDYTKKVAEAALGRKESIKNSVRKQVEGFVAALRNPRTRVIRFSWGKMSYKGTLNSLDIRYTMFSEEGYPIRASVQLGMTLLDERVYAGSIGQWEEKVKSTFPAGQIGIPGVKDDAAAITNNVSGSQYVNSLFNVSL